MKKVQCIIMVGPSGCGKSTLSKKLESTGYEVFSSDGYRKHHYGAEEIQTNPKYIFERLYADAAHALAKGQSIVIDATNIKPADRTSMFDAILAISQKTRSEIGFIAIDFSDVPLSECLENNKKRSRHVPEEVIAKQFLIYKQHPITENDGFDAVYQSQNSNTLQILNIPENVGNMKIHKEEIATEDNKELKQALNRIQSKIEFEICKIHEGASYDESLYNGAYKDGLYDALAIVEQEKPKEIEEEHEEEGLEQ